MGGRRATSFPQALLVGILTIGAFASTLNVTLLSPLLKPIALDFGVSDAAAGQLATLTAASAGVTALVVAPWLDRFSRGAWLRVESVLLFGGTLVSILAPSFAWLFVGRALAGVGGAFIFAVCLAAVGDAFADPSRRNRAIGVVGSGCTFGAVVGLPIVTQIAAVGGWRWAMALLLPFAVVLFAAASRLPEAGTSKGGFVWRDWATDYGRILADRQTISLLGVMVALSVTWFGWLIYFGAYAEGVFGSSAATLGLLFLVAGGAELAANGVTPRLLRGRSALTIVLWAVAILALNLLAVGVVYTQPWALFPFITIASLASVVLFMSTSILLLDAQPAARGAVMALQAAGFEFGGAAGVAAVGTALAVLADYEAVYRLLGAVPLMLLVPLVLAAGRPNRVAARSAPDRGDLLAARPAST